MSFFLGVIGKKSIRLVTFVTDLVVLILGANMIYYGTMITIDSAGNTLPLLMISRAWARIPLVICGMFIVVGALNKLMKPGGEDLHGNN
jgi:TRAP-type C4-dicarboxylate transport system permease small subunit